METLGVEAVQLSFGRCCMKKDFIETFYKLFLDSRPEIRNMFKNTDFTKQRKLLVDGLNMMISCAMGQSFSASYLEQLAEKHSRRMLNVDPSLYQYWLDSLIKAVETHDPKYTPELGQAWRTHLSRGIEIMKSKY